MDYSREAFMLEKTQKLTSMNEKKRKPLRTVAFSLLRIYSFFFIAHEPTG